MVDWPKGRNCEAGGARRRFSGVQVIFERGGVPTGPVDPPLPLTRRSAAAASSTAAAAAASTATAISCIFVVSSTKAWRLQGGDKCSRPNGVLVPLCNTNGCYTWLVRVAVASCWRTRLPQRAVLLFGEGASSTPRTRAIVCQRPHLRLRSAAQDRSLDREPLTLRCDPEHYSTLLWPPAMCNHSCIRQELACYTTCNTLNCSRPNCVLG